MTKSKKDYLSVANDCEIMGDECIEQRCCNRQVELNGFPQSHQFFNNNKITYFCGNSLVVEYNLAKVRVPDHLFIFIGALAQMLEQTAHNPKESNGMLLKKSNK